MDPREDRSDLAKMFATLARYEVVGWRGQRIFDAGGGQIPVSRGGVTKWAISAGVQHLNADHIHITVISHSRVPGRNLGQTQSWAINAIMQASRDYGLPPVERIEQIRREAALEQEAERLKVLARHGGLICKLEAISVDSLPTLFQVYEVDGGRSYPGVPGRRPLWSAFGALHDVDLIVDSWGVPLAGLELARVTTPVPPPCWLDRGR